MNVRILPLLSTQLNIFFSPVVCRRPKAASKACHAQTSCAHPPTLGQAGVRARAELQLLTRALVVVISESYTF